MKKIFFLLFILLSVNLFAKTRRASHISHHTTYHLKQRTSQFFINGSEEFFPDNSSFSIGLGYTKEFKNYSICPSGSFGYDETSVLGSAIEFDFWKNNSPISFGLSYQNSYDFLNKIKENWISFKPNYNFQINKHTSFFLYISPNFKLDNSNGFEYSFSNGIGVDYIFSKKFSFEFFINNQTNFEKTFYPSFGMAIGYF
jgi:hypothetical protein